MGKVWVHSVRSTGDAGTLTRGLLDRYLLEPRKWEMGTVQVYPDCANDKARHVSSVGRVNMCHVSTTLVGLLDLCHVCLGVDRVQEATSVTSGAEFFILTLLRRLIVFTINMHRECKQ